MQKHAPLCAVYLDGWVHRIQAEAVSDYLGRIGRHLSAVKIPGRTGRAILPIRKVRWWRWAASCNKKAVQRVAWCCCTPPNSSYGCNFANGQQT